MSQVDLAMERMAQVLKARWPRSYHVMSKDTLRALAEAALCIESSHLQKAMSPSSMPPTGSECANTAGKLPLEAASVPANTSPMPKLESKVALFTCTDFFLMHGQEPMSITSIMKHLIAAVATSRKSPHLKTTTAEE